MDGIFIRKKTNIWFVLLLLCGAYFIGQYVYLRITEPELVEDLIYLLVMGVLSGLLALPAMLLNHGAYIHVGESTIKARYHWFGKLDCTIDEVEFVRPQVNMLTILMKSGKRHTITGLSNAGALCDAIRRQSFQPETESADAIRKKLAQAQDARKKEMWKVIAGCVLMFVVIFIAVLLTGGRDLGEFTKMDWIIFAGMGIVELVMVVYLFIFADRCGKLLLPVEQLKYRLRVFAVVSCPLPTDDAIAVYTDADCWGRIVLCGFPNDDGVYYCVQQSAGNYELKTVRTSEIFENAEDLPEEAFAGLMDITSCF